MGSSAGCEAIFVQAYLLGLHNGGGGALSPAGTTWEGGVGNTAGGASSSGSSSGSLGLCTSADVRYACSEYAAPASAGGCVAKLLLLSHPEYDDVAAEVLEPVTMRYVATSHPAHALALHSAPCTLHSALCTR